MIPPSQSQPQSRSHGLLLVFEGPDGCGKTTLSQTLTTQLQEAGVDVAWESFPGKAERTLGELVYRLHHDATSVGIDDITDSAVQALHIAAHLDSIETRLRPQLQAGRTLILDRFWWSTWVYGLQAGVREDVLVPLIQAEKAIWGSLSPDVIFMMRRQLPINRNISPKEWSDLTALYGQIAEREIKHQRVVYVDNDAAPSVASEVVMEVVHSLSTVLPGK